jgi:hypothetical protein
MISIIGPRYIPSICIKYVWQLHNSVIKLYYFCPTHITHAKIYFGTIYSSVSSMKERLDDQIVKYINHMLISCANNEADVTTE